MAQKVRFKRREIGQADCQEQRQPGNDHDGPPEGTARQRKTAAQLENDAGNRDGQEDESHECRNDRQSDRLHELLS